MTTQGQVRNFYPAMRVFVFGMEVTEDVLSASTTHTDARAPSTAEIVLANKAASSGGYEDRYVVTDSDVTAMTELLQAAALQRARIAEKLSGRNTDPVHSQAEAVTTAADLLHWAGIQILEATPDPLKRTVLAAKVRHLVQLLHDPRLTSVPHKATIDEFLAFQGFARRYPFQVGDCIFHSNDPVRIFFRDPRDPRTWYHQFAGFITDWVDDVDENNVRTVTLRCEDVLRTLRYARYTTSPGLIDARAAVTEADLAVRTWFQDDFSAQLTFVEFVFTMVFGFQLTKTAAKTNVASTNKTFKRLVKAELIGPRNTNEIEITSDATGLFNFDKSLILVLGRDTQLTTVSTISDGKQFPIENLANYQAVVDHQVRVEDLKSMAYTGLEPLTATVIDPLTQEPAIEDVIRVIGEHPEVYPVDGGRLIMLVPTTLGSQYNAGVFFKDFKGVELKTKWTNRLGKIYDTVERIEFSFYASPKGDILCEMPLYDFDPSAFGTRAVSHRDLKDIFGQDRAELLLLPGHVAGPFAPNYAVPRQDTIRWSRTFSDEKVRTFATSQHYNIELLQGAGTSEQAGKAPARVYLESLVPQFGVRAIEADPSILAITKDAAEIYCQLLLNRTNAEARTANVSALPNLYLLPNRPVLFHERSYVGTLREVAESLVWGERGDMNMTLRVDRVRGWDGLLDEDGARVYSYLGGSASNFLAYAVLLGNRKPPASLNIILAAPREEEPSP
jgi:hypothetical protein